MSVQECHILILMHQDCFQQPWHNTQCVHTHKYTTLHTHTNTHRLLKVLTEEDDTWGRVEVFPCPPCPFCWNWTSPTGWAVNSQYPKNFHTQHICMNTHAHAHAHTAILRCLLQPAAMYSHYLLPQWEGAFSLTLSTETQPRLPSDYREFQFDKMPEVEQFSSTTRESCTHTVLHRFDKVQYGSGLPCMQCSFRALWRAQGTSVTVNVQTDHSNSLWYVRRGLIAIPQNRNKVLLNYLSGASHFKDCTVNYCTIKHCSTLW